MAADVTLTGVSQGMANTNTQAIKLTQDFGDFLRLLTTQLQNQDPLNPMDSTEFTNQLVQFSQVEQSINTNQKLDDMLALQVSSISTVALGYVGLDITYTSAEMNWDGTTPIDINYVMPSEAKVAKVNVYDENGDVVRSLDAPKAAGTHKVTWDGKDNNGNVVAEGTYTLRVDAADKDDKPIETTTAVTGRVRGIESQNGVIFLLVGDRAIALGNVIQAVKPQTAANATTPEGETGDDNSDGGTDAT